MRPRRRRRCCSRVHNPLISLPHHRRSNTNTIARPENRHTRARTHARLFIGASKVFRSRVSNVSFFKTQMWMCVHSDTLMFNSYVTYFSPIRLNSSLILVIAAFKRQYYSVINDGSCSHVSVRKNSGNVSAVSRAYTLTFSVRRESKHQPETCFNPNHWAFSTSTREIS